MTPGGRGQAAIELLDLIIDAARGGGGAADTLITRYFKERRYAGSSDRRAIRELVYRAIRRSGERPLSGRTALAGLAQDDPAVAALFDGSPHGPAPLAANEPVAEASLLPAWLVPLLDPLIEADEHGAMLERAPLDLRVNRLRGTRDEALALIPEAVATPLSPLGLRLPEGTRIDAHACWRDGLVEVQDEGSQLLALACGVQPGQRVLDLCAGAGGKTLALAAEMRNEGEVIAADTDRPRLSRMTPRLERAGISIVTARLLNPGSEQVGLDDLTGQCDLVLVDAPCSGSGTWRRNPETRWRLTPERLDRLVALQAELLDRAAGLVKPGGRLVYAVCSLLAREGREQAAAFTARSALTAQPVTMMVGRKAGTGTMLSPGHDGTDGFFVAAWSAPC